MSEKILGGIRVWVFLGSFILPILTLTWFVSAVAMNEGSASHGLGSSATISQNVELVDEVGGSMKAVAVQGDYVYLGAGGRLFILNVQVPSQPVRVSQPVLFPGYIIDIVIKDNYAYIANNRGGLRILDVADPRNPFEIGALVTPGHVRSVVVSDNFAYLAERPVWDGTQFVGGGLRIVNVEDPAAPYEVGRYKPSGGELYWGTEYVAVAEGYAYLSEYKVEVDDRKSVFGLRILNVKNPGAPTSVGFVDLTERYGVSDVVVQDNIAYVMSEWRLYTYDISSPSTPVRLGEYFISANYGHIAVQGQYAYLVCQSCFDGLHIVDISDPTQLF